MGIFLNPHTKLRSNVAEDIYIDKSLIIEELNKSVGKNSRFVCVTRPRRFGKTMIANMIASYYGRKSGDDDILDKMAIAQSPSYRQHLGKYDVIKIDMQGVCDMCKERNKKQGTSTDALTYLDESLVKELAQEYPNVVNDKMVLSEALLSVNEATQRKFVIVIDEWDSIMRNNPNNQEQQDEYINFLRSLFKNDHLNDVFALAYLTGILPIIRYKTQSAMNNFREYTMLKPRELAPYIGFTQDDVELLSRKYNIPLADMERWYNGYILNGIHIYCPLSVVEAIMDNDFLCHWGETDALSSITSFINGNLDGVRDGLLEMASGKEVPVNIGKFSNNLREINSKDAVFTFLIHLGYLRYNDETKMCSVPNEEVRITLLNAIEDSEWSGVAEIIRQSRNLLIATTEGNEAFVAEALNVAHQNCCSILKYNDENSLACAIMLAYSFAWDKYIVVREMPAGKGFADLVLIPTIPNQPAFVVELKRNDSAGNAIAQIKERNYTGSLEKLRGQSRIILVGVNYDPETKEHTCKIEEMAG